MIKPDIVIERKSDNAIFVCDTKWKLLSDKNGISQSDMYQMYAYQKKYSAQNTTLLYPLTDNVSGENIEYDSGDGVVVRVRFIDLFDLHNSLKELVAEF